MKRYFLAFLTAIMLVFTLAISGCSAEVTTSSGSSSKSSQVISGTDNSSDSGDSGMVTPTPDYGTLTIADVSFEYGSSGTIIPIFSNVKETITYTFDGDDISINGNTVTGNVPNAIVTVTATTEHLSTTFTVSVWKDFGILSVADVEVGYGKTAEINPVFSKDSEEITYSYDTSKISIEGNVVTGLVAEAVVEVTATTKHLNDTFTVTVGKNYNFKIADISVEYGKTATVSPVFEVEANAETVEYMFSGNDISVSGGVIKGLTAEAEVEVTAKSAHYESKFTVKVGKDYTFSVANVEVEYKEEANIVVKFTADANAEAITYTYDTSKITIADGKVTGLVAGAEVEVTAKSAHHEAKFTVKVGNKGTQTLTVNYTGTPTAVASHVEQVEEEASYSVATPTVVGYTPEQTVVSGTMGKSNVTVTVKYNANVYNVSYNYNGGTAGANNPSIGTYDSAFTVSSPTRSGYKFSGWQVSGVNVATALYGSSSAQTNKVLSDLSYCYQKNSSDKDENSSEYWNGDVTFKNLSATNGTSVTLKATWSYLGKIADATNSFSVINNANGNLNSSKVLEIASGLKGSFVLTFSYYQNAVVDETSSAYTANGYRTGVLGIRKHNVWTYYTHIRQDGYSWKGTETVGTVSSSDNAWNASNDYGEMFYGLVKNGYSSDSTKFVDFVRNSLVTYTIKGYAVGNRNGKLEITQTIKSYSEAYKNQTATIVYDVNLADGVYYNAGVDFHVKCEDTDISFTDASLVIMADGYQYVDTKVGSWPTLASSYAHYAPDKYWEGDFDYTVSWNQSSANNYTTFADNCWRTGILVVYNWDNVNDSVGIRQDWWADTGSQFSGELQNVNSADDFDGTSGRFTSYGGNANTEIRLFKNASVSCRIIRSGNTVCVYQFISTPGSSYVTLVNGYKFTTSATKLSFQVVGVLSGIDITYEDYAANTKVISGQSLGGATYGLGSYGYDIVNTRIHVALPYPVPKGTVVSIATQDTYDFGVIQLSKFYGKDEGNYLNSDSKWKDSGWITDTTTYTVTEDCYIAVNIRYESNADMSSVDVIGTLRSLISITMNLPDNLNTNVKTFTSSMLEANSTYGLTTYSGQWGESNARCHVAVIPLLKKGTTISFTGGANYMFSINELANERIVLHDTGWMNHDTVYTLTRDCYIAINVKHITDYDYTFEGKDIKTLLYNSIKIEGTCGMVVCENIETYSATEEGDMQSVNHRGYSWTAPENTAQAYSLSKYNGFTKVECDINFTKDGYAVLLHDGTVQRTTNNATSGHISTFNYSDIRNYDFGSFKGSEYSAVIIPSAEEFLIQCKTLGLHPYLELKEGTKAQIQRLAVLVRRYGMEDNVTWISFDLNCLTYIRDVSPKARLGYLASDVDQNVINNALTLRTGENEVFLDIFYGNFQTSENASSRIALCRANNLPLEIWTVDDEAIMKAVYTATGGYVTGFTSDNIIAEDVNFG